MSGENAISVFESLPKLKELSMDINPCSSHASFNYELILKLPKIKMLNDEAVRDLDKDVAR